MPLECLYSLPLSMSKIPPPFAGSIPEKYDRFLGPYIFEPYARELAARAVTDNPQSILETACGTGRVTRASSRAEHLVDPPRDRPVYDPTMGTTLR